MMHFPQGLTVSPPARLSTGVEGLDRILKGGFLRGGSYLLEGPSGVGKTVLANQLAFHHASTGGRTIYMSLLSESYGRLLLHLQGFRFFDESVIGTEILYLGGYQALEEGTRPLLDLILRNLHNQSSTLLIIDGLLGIAERTDSLGLRSFLHELQVHAELLGCTTLLVSPVGTTEFRPEHSVVDGILRFCRSSQGLRNTRELRVQKLRGSAYLGGGHVFEITGDGFRVAPRTEAALGRNTLPPPEAHARLSLGVPELDAMAGGGVLEGTSTMALGAPGTGKTVLGLHFLAAVAQEEGRALHFGFYESPARLIGKAQGVGLPFQELIDRGKLRISWQLPIERPLDFLVEDLLREVREHHISRLFLDGLDGFRQSAAFPERLEGLFTVLTNELRSLGVTTLLTAESATLFGSEVNEPLDGVSAIVENLVLLRYVELHSRVHRMIGILKLRESPSDSNLRELEITERGIRLGDTFQGAESLLSGIARMTGR